MRDEELRVQEMAQDWSHCLDAAFEFETDKDPNRALHRFLQRERQEAREHERDRIRETLNDALRYAEEAGRAGDLNDLVKRREMLEELLVAVSRVQDVLTKPCEVTVVIERFYVG